MIGRIIFETFRALGIILLSIMMLACLYWGVSTGIEAIRELKGALAPILLIAASAACAVTVDMIAKMDY